MVTHTQGREATSFHPARRSPTTLEEAATCPRLRGLILSRKTALTTNVAASKANASPAPTPRTSAVARAGPASSAMFFIDSVSARASWIKGSGTVCGSSPVYAGWKKASAAPKHASMTTSSQMRLTPLKISMASSPCRAARTRSVATMI